MRLAIPSLAEQSLPKKLIMGFAVLASAALIASISVASANPSGKPTKEQCETAGYANYGQCVSDWAKNKSGYGGGGQGGIIADTNVEVDAAVVGDNNVVQFVVNVYNTINIFN